MENQNKASSAAKGNKTRGASRQKAPSKKSAPKGGSSVRAQRPAAQRTKVQKLRSGSSRIKKQRFVIGYTYAGNGTLGVAGQVYFQPVGLTADVVAVNHGAPMVPIVGSDIYVGDPYIADEMKHFSRYRVDKIKVILDSQHQGTANDGTVYLAPVRGFGDQAGGTTSTSASAVGFTGAQCESFDGVVKAAVWENTEVDLMPFVAGGFGPKQNEFPVGGAGTSASSILLLTNNWVGVVPCCIVIGGQVTTASLNGSILHNVVVERTIECLDFIGAGTIYNPIGFYAAEIERCQKILDAHAKYLSTDRSKQGSKSSGPTCRQLFDLRRRLQASGVAIPEDANCEPGCPSCAQRNAALGLTAKTL